MTCPNCELLKKELAALKKSRLNVKSLPSAYRKEALRLAAFDSMPAAKIAKKLNLNYTTVWRWLNKEGIRFYHHKYKCYNPSAKPALLIAVSNGLPITKAAIRYDVSYCTALNWCKKAGIKSKLQRKRSEKQGTT